MINNILKQNTDNVNFKKIISPDAIITDYREIKETTHLHFQNWTKSNPLNQEE